VYRTIFASHDGGRVQYLTSMLRLTVKECTRALHRARWFVVDGTDGHEGFDVGFQSAYEDDSHYDQSAVDVSRRFGVLNCWH